MKFPTLPLCKPAFYAHILSALIMVVAMVIFALNAKRFFQMDPLHVVMILLLFSIAMAVHGHSHMRMEKLYHFDPLCQLLA